VPVADLDDNGPDFDNIVDRAATIFSAVEINKSLRSMIFIHSFRIFCSHRSALIRINPKYKAMDNGVR
jgi:hypothetical protein